MKIVEKIILLFVVAAMLVDAITNMIMTRRVQRNLRATQEFMKLLAEIDRRKE